MLNERDYMKMNQAPFRSGPGRKDNGVSAVKILILINIAVFIMQYINPPILPNYALISPRVIKEHEYYRVVTCMFLHGGFLHIFLNMWVLHLFGSLLEQRIGKKHFLIMYFLSGIIGSCFWLLVNPSSNNVCIGASGAVVGAVIATAMFFPDLRVMLIIPPIPMKLKTLAIVFVIFDLVSEFFNFEGAFLGRIAHIVHLGGALAGYLYIKIKFRKEIVWDILPDFNVKQKSSSCRVPSGWSVGESSSDSGSRVTQNELDQLLDKISLSGINSLSEDEIEALRRAREQMQQGRGR